MFNVSEKLTLLIKSEPHQYQNTVRHYDAITMTPHPTSHYLHHCRIFDRTVSSLKTKEFL